MRSHATLVLVLGALTLAPPADAAITVDGHLDPDYGAALATQTTQTSFVDANPLFSPNPTLYADGTELDGLYLTVDGGVLHLLIAGNMGFCCPTMFSHQEEFDVFIDTGAGGQHTLRSDNAAVGGLNGLAGLTFDAGFDADYWLSSTVNMSSDYAELPAGGGGAGYVLGFNTAGSPGTLTGGTNPFGILAAVDNSNGAGVTTGCAAASGAGVTTGVEWAIPLAALGNPTGCVRVCVVATNFQTHALGNQTLGASPPGTCALGAPAGVDLSSIAGNQYVTICLGPTPTSGSTWGRLKTIYR
jgi:hypothetical protein